MAAAATMATSIVSRCPLLHSIGQRSPTVIPAAPLGPSFIRFFRRSTSQFRLVCMASSAAGNPYESEKAYDRIMMSQLQNRKKGLTFGSFKVSRDIKYADKQPIASWGPRCQRISRMLISSQKYPGVHGIPDQMLRMRINMAISAVFEYGEDEGKGLLMGRGILRSLPLVFRCIAVSSLCHTGLLNLIEFLGRATPLFLYNNQELFVPLATSITLCIFASYHR